jgi:hypothetical protein
MRSPACWLALVLLMACDGSSSRPRPSVPSSSTATRDELTAGIHALDLGAEDCSTESSLSNALVASGPDFAHEIDPDWDARARCDLTDPTRPGSPAAFADVDGDGSEEAIALVHYERRYGERGTEWTGDAIVVLRARGDDVMALLSVSDGGTIAGTDDSFEALSGAEARGRHVIVSGANNFHDCGSDSLEMTFDCATGTCVYHSVRYTTRAPACDSP